MPSRCATNSTKPTNFEHTTCRLPHRSATLVWSCRTISAGGEKLKWLQKRPISPLDCPEGQLRCLIHPSFQWFKILTFAHTSNTSTKLGSLGLNGTSGCYKPRSIVQRRMHAQLTVPANPQISEFSASNSDGHVVISYWCSKYWAIHSTCRHLFKLSHNTNLWGKVLKLSEW